MKLLHGVKPSWPTASLGELLRLERRPVKIEPAKQYQEVGIYCFGRGVFHKTPRSGFEVGNKRLFLLKEGDFILQVTFAWEGAVALLSAAEDGMYGSTRYPTFRVDESRCLPKFLLYYFKTEEGLDQLVRISPGSAGRNRVLSLKRIPELIVPLPPLATQRRVVARIEELAAQVDEARALRQQAEADGETLVGRAIAAFLDEPGWETEILGDLLAEPPRNGLSPRAEVDSGGRPMLRINAVSSSPSRYVDLSAIKRVEISDEEAEPFVIRHEDVFIVRYNGDINRVAKPAIYKATGECRAVFPDKLMRLRPDHSKMLPDFLVFALNARSVRKQIEGMGKSTAGNIGVSGANAKSFVVPVPPLPEQHRIVGALDGLQTKASTLKRLQVQTAAEIDALLPAILDRAFRGEL
jgi:type I restriction enzyme S subunit